MRTLHALLVTAVLVSPIDAFAERLVDFQAYPDGSPTVVGDTVSDHFAAFGLSMIGTEAGDATITDVGGGDRWVTGEGLVLSLAEPSDGVSIVAYDLLGFGGGAIAYDADGVELELIPIVSAPGALAEFTVGGIAEVHVVPGFGGPVWVNRSV